MSVRQRIVIHAKYFTRFEPSVKVHVGDIIELQLTEPNGRVAHLSNTVQCQQLKPNGDIEYPLFDKGSCFISIVVNRDNMLIYVICRPAHVGVQC
jgi:hypothetical protein